MKTPFLHLLLPAVLACMLPAGCGPAERAPAESHALEIRLLPGERWWTGVIADAHHFPLDSSSAYRFDFWGNTAGNQGQPLLLSNRGRYVWNEEPFRFEFSGGTLRCHSDRADFSSGTAGETLREAYLHCSRSFFPPSGAMPAEELFRAPQFNTWIEFTYHQNQQGILDYARGIVGHGFEPGVLMIDEGWFIDYGNWEFDPLRFPDPQAMMAQLNGLGFSVMLWICPYYSPDGLFWKEQWLRTTREGDTIWVVNAEDPSMPAVMRWWDGQSNVIDLSRPNGRNWFRAQLDRLMADYGVAGFKFDGGDAEHYSERGFLTETRSYRPDIHANEHSRLFAELGLAYPMNEYRAAWKMGGQALAMRLRDKNHDWADLRKLIPGSICQGLMGYPYTCPDLIGGGEYLSFRNQDSIDQELVVRAHDAVFGGPLAGAQPGEPGHLRAHGRTAHRHVGLHPGAGPGLGPERRTHGAPARLPVPGAGL